jgi:hypothetical protein
MEAIDAEVAALRARAADEGRPLDAAEQGRVDSLLSERAEVQQLIDAQWAYSQSLAFSASRPSNTREHAR